MTQTLSQLENSGAFIERHIGPDAAQQQEMLNAVGAQSLNALTGQIVPKDIQLATPPQVGAPATEYAALAELKAIASRNKRFTSYIGMGYTAVQALVADKGNRIVVSRNGRIMDMDMEEALAETKEFQMERYDILEALTNNGMSRLR